VTLTLVIAFPQPPHPGARAVLATGDTTPALAVPGGSDSAPVDGHIPAPPPMAEAIKGCGAKSPASPPMSMAKFKADLEVALAPEARAKWAFVLALAIVAVMAARLYESITEAHAVPSRMHGGRASGPNRTPLSDTASLVALSCALWLLALQVMPEGGGAEGHKRSHVAPRSLPLLPCVYWLC
jgi:hypothetical protein